MAAAPLGARSAVLRRMTAAVEQDGLVSEIAVAHHGGYEVGYLLGRAQTAHGARRRQLPPDLRVRRQHVGLDECGRHYVDRHSVRGTLARQAMSQPVEAGFRSRVMG